MLNWRLQDKHFHHVSSQSQMSRHWHAPIGVQNKKPKSQNGEPVLNFKDFFSGIIAVDHKTLSNKYIFSKMKLILTRFSFAACYQRLY